MLKSGFVMNRIFMQSLTETIQYHRPYAIHVSLLKGPLKATQNYLGLVFNSQLNMTRSEPTA